MRSRSGYNTTTPMVTIKEPSDGIVELRRLLSLPENADLVACSISAGSFEEALGNIAAKLLIAVDDVVDAEKFIRLLVVRIKELRYGKVNIILTV